MDVVAAFGPDELIDERVDVAAGGGGAACGGLEGVVKGQCENRGTKKWI